MNTQKQLFIILSITSVLLLCSKAHIENINQPPIVNPSDSIKIIMNGIDCIKYAYPHDTVSFNAKIYSKDSSLLHFEWDFNGDGITDTSANEPNCKFIYKKVGIYPVKMNVVYTTQIIGTDSAIITIVPYNLSLKTTPDTIAPLKSTIHLSASASGSSDSLYKYEWSIDGNPFVGVSGNDTTITLPNTYRKNYICKCRVTDVFGSTTVDTVNIEVGIWTVIDSIGPVGEGYYDVDAATDGKQIAFTYLTNSLEVAFYDSSFHRTVVKSSWYQDLRLLFSHNKFLVSFCDLKSDVALCAYEYNGAGWNNLSEKTFLNEKDNYHSGMFYLNDKLTITSIQANNKINFFTKDDYNWVIKDSLPTSVVSKYDNVEHDNSVYLAVSTYPDHDIQIYKYSGTEKTKLCSTNVKGFEPSLFFIDGTIYVSYRPDNSQAVTIISFQNNYWEKFSDPEIETGVSSEYHCIVDSLDHTIYIAYSDSEHDPYVKIYQNGNWANVGKGTVKKYLTGNWLRNMRLIMMQGIPYLILNMSGKIYLLSVK